MDVHIFIGILIVLFANATLAMYVSRYTLFRNPSRIILIFNCTQLASIYVHIKDTNYRCVESFNNLERNDDEGDREKKIK